MQHLSFEPRRRRELYDELLSRARAWLADWHPSDEGDFATALFKIAARIESEVTQRLDRAPEKTFRGFLDWLGVKGQPGRAARLPVVFTMTPGSDPVDAPPPVQLQISVGDATVNFETERPLRILPGSLATIVAVDPKADSFYQPPASIFSLEEPPLVPNTWRLKSEAPAGTRTLQLDPPLGLDVGITLSDPSGQQYRITEVQGAIVAVEPKVGTIEPKEDQTPGAGGALAAGTVMTRVEVFTPFSPTERNRQEHALYIGSGGALNIATPAWIEIQGGSEIPPDATWWYSGKPSPAVPDGWIEIKEVNREKGRLLLHKPKGAVETLKVDGYESRWLRATRPPGNISQPSTATELRLLVNCDLPPGEAAPPVRGLEGIANTAPLVLDSGFYPFGREPRQFDSFYLGSKEAFTKPAAKVIAHFELGEAVGSARAAIGISDTEYHTVGISNDGRLQRISHGVSGGAPTLSFLSPTQPTTAEQRPVGLNGNLRPGAAVAGGVPYATAAAGNEVWLWKEVGGRETWQSQGKPFNDAARVDHTVLTRSGANLALYAVADGTLYRRIVDGQDWQEVVLPTTDPVLMIAPVVPIAGRAGEQTENDGVAAVTDQGDMYLGVAGTWNAAPGGPAIDPDFYPLVVLTAAGDRLCLTRNQLLEPVAFDTQGGPGFAAGGVELIGHALDFVPRGDEVMAVLVGDSGNGQAAVAVWDGFNDAPPQFDSSGIQPSEGPVVVAIAAGGRFIFVPGEDGKAYVTRIGQGEFLSSVDVTDAALFTDAQDWSLETNLFIDIGGNVNNRVLAVDDVLLAVSPDRWLFKLSEASKPSSGAIQVDVYKAFHAQPRAGIWNAANELELEPGDPDASANRYVSVEVGAKKRVIKIDSISAGVATLSNNMPAANVGDAVPYRVCQPAPLAAVLTVELLPAIDISNLDGSIAGALASGTVESLDPGLTPTSQTVRHIIPGDIVVLTSPWDGNAKPDPTNDFFANIDLFGTWESFEPPTPRNPTLSWEYFDGAAWRQVPGLRDHTEALAKAGDVIFCVPKDLQPTDVVGRTNNWIRARLVGGDYGQETVTVTTTPGTPAGTTIQTVKRSTDSIRAPYVGSLTVQYEVCCPVTPDLVLARDNGGLRNQTEVNRRSGAVVEYFLPLSEALARAAGRDALAGAADRALFLGFDTKLTDGPIQILFLVEEGSHDDAFPLRVDALIGNRFKPLVVADNTRGLNESGTLDMTLGESPQLAELFGTTQYWLRVRPGVRLSSDKDWQPRIRGAYLNATFALAADTQTFELLGSSDGSPNQRFALARLPVIEGSLRLRILERLGDEDMAALRKKGIHIKDNSDPEFPKQPIGCWVLWRQVVDPADEGPGERVYALDDATGVITFGDGRHGMIPPIGTDVIVAESYQRGGGEAANAITAWPKINLVTPLAGVNDVIAPYGAAGGSDPQDPPTTLRFAPANLRLRDRALTLADFEMLALQFSRDIAQARAIPTPRGMRLVVAMRGRSSIPPAEVIRELKTYLLNHASPALAAKDAVQIVGPEEIPVRIDLGLTVDAIEWSGAVAGEARKRLERLFDAAIGGHDGVGWALGQLPSDADIAGALEGMSHLEEIARITVTATDGRPLTTVKPSQLVRLAVDGVTVTALLPQEATP